MSGPHALSPAQARNILLRSAGFGAPPLPPGPTSLRQLLRDRRCIQLDPLDVIGANADLVAHARVEGVTRGALDEAVLPGHAFVHFAKERCLIPARRFPLYQRQAVQTPWWRLSERLKRVPGSALDAVLAAITERGPLGPWQLDLGTVAPMDWSGWKGTGRLATMALEILWTRCQVVTVARTTRGTVYDLPERALPDLAQPPTDQSFDRTGVMDRVHAAGMLSRAGGPWWSMLSLCRTGPLPDDLIKRGDLVHVRVTGSRRTYLTLPTLMQSPPPESDDRMRILGPLDPLIWDRKLVHHAFGFEYVWEVYKPAAKRRWGWYVCPLLHRNELVGRIQARRTTLDNGRFDIDVERLWVEHDSVDQAALYDALHRLCDFQGRPPDQK